MIDWGSGWPWSPGATTVRTAKRKATGAGPSRGGGVMLDGRAKIRSAQDLMMFLGEYGDHLSVGIELPDGFVYRIDRAECAVQIVDGESVLVLRTVGKAIGEEDG